MIHFLFPSDLFNKRVVDEDYQDELNALASRGFSHSLFSFEDFQDGKFKPFPVIPTDATVIYRGWMMTPEVYSTLYDALVTSGGRLLTNPTQYRQAHHMPEWLTAPDMALFTPSTIVVPREADFVEAVKDTGWQRFFVKDYVKSLSTGRGPFADTPEQISEIVDLMEKYRGFVEGGVCIREFERFKPESETRYFSVNHKIYGPYGHVPTIVEVIANRIDSPFFSIDMAASLHNGLRLIEIGDGQVSSRKQWDADVFAEIFKD
jgi:hypothetical protein